MGKTRRNRRIVKGDETYDAEVHPLLRKVPADHETAPPRMRDGYASARVGTKIYIIGGVSVGARPSHQFHGQATTTEETEGANTFSTEYRLNDVAVYDTQDGTWSVVQTKGDRPRPRSHHAAVAVGNRIYVHGGEGTTLTKTSADGSTTRRDNGESTRRRSLSQNSAEHFSSDRNLPELHRDFFYLDTKTLTWYRVDVGEGATKKTEDREKSQAKDADGSPRRRGSLADEFPEMFGNTEEQVSEGAVIPSMRRCHTLSLWMNGNRPSIVMFGGFTRVEFGKREDTPLNDIFTFDILASRWMQLNPKSPVAPSPRGSHATITTEGNLLWLYGGYGKQGSFGDLWSFDLSTGRWKLHYNRADTGKQPASEKESSEHSASLQTSRSITPSGTPQGQGTTTPGSARSARSFSFLGKPRTTRSKFQERKRESYPLPDACYGHRLEQDPWDSSRFLLCGGRTSFEAPHMTVWAFDTKKYCWNWLPVTPEEMSPFVVPSDPAAYSSRKNEMELLIQNPQSHRAAAEEYDCFPWPRYYFIMHNLGMSYQEEKLKQVASTGFPASRNDESNKSSLKDVRKFFRNNKLMISSSDTEDNQTGKVHAPPPGWGSAYSENGSLFHRVKRTEDGETIIERATLRDKQAIRNEYDFKRVVIMGGIYVEDPSSLIKKNARKLNRTALKGDSRESKTADLTDVSRHSNPLAQYVNMLYRLYVEERQKRMQQQSWGNQAAGNGKQGSASSYIPKKLPEFSLEEFKTLLIGDQHAVEDERIDNNDPDFVFKWRDRQAVSNARSLVFSLAPPMGLAQLTDVYHVCFPPSKNKRSLAQHQGVLEEFLTDKQSVGKLMSSRRSTSSESSHSRQRSSRTGQGSDMTSPKRNQNQHDGLPAVSEDGQVEEGSLESNLFQPSALVEELLQYQSDEEETPKLYSVSDDAENLFVRKSNLSMCDPVSSIRAAGHITRVPERKETVDIQHEKDKNYRPQPQSNLRDTLVKTERQEKLDYLKWHLPLSAHQQHLEGKEDNMPVHFPPQFFSLPANKLSRQSQNKTTDIQGLRTNSPTLMQQRQRTMNLSRSHVYKGKQLSQDLLQAARGQAVNFSNSLKRSAASILQATMKESKEAYEEASARDAERQREVSEDFEVSSDEHSVDGNYPEPFDDEPGEDPFPDVVPNEYIAGLVSGASYAAEPIRQQTDQAENAHKAALLSTKEKALKDIGSLRSVGTKDQLRELSIPQLRRLVAEALDLPRLSVHVYGGRLSPESKHQGDGAFLGKFAELEESHVPGTVGRRLIQRTTSDQLQDSARGNVNEEPSLEQVSERTSKTFLNENTARTLLKHGIISNEDTHRGLGNYRADTATRKKRSSQGSKPLLTPVAAAQATAAANKILQEGIDVGAHRSILGVAKQSGGGREVPSPEKLERELMIRNAQIEYGVDCILQAIDKRKPGNA